MDLRKLVSIRLRCFLIFELCVLTPTVNSQIQGCSIEGIDLLQCLNQGNISSIDICCKSLNQVVRAGYNCLCSLVASNIPVLSTPLSLPLSNCLISVPPLSLCPVLAPMPVVLPPAAYPKENITQPSSPSQTVLMPPAPGEMQVPLNKSRGDNSTTEAMRPESIDNLVPKCNMSKDGNETANGKDGTKILLHRSLFLSLALIGCILLA